MSSGAVPAPDGLTQSFGRRDRVIASRDDLDAALDYMARGHRRVFFAGLPGVGKSLYIRELAGTAHSMGRRVHSLQWDVARPAFTSPSIAARYPDRDNICNPMVRKGVGQWVRQAVLRWDRENAGDQSILIGEVPLIGHRLLELVQVHTDAAEAILADARTLFVTPVPSVAVRAAIEQARSRTFTNPSNPREREDAPVDVVRKSWEEVRSLAVDLGFAKATATNTVPFDPDAYAGVYRHLLRKRNSLTLRVEVELKQAASVYDHHVDVTDVVPTYAEAEAIIARLECEHTPAQIEAEVARWSTAI